MLVIDGSNSRHMVSKILNEAFFYNWTCCFMFIHNVVSMLNVRWWPNFFSLGVINRICGVPSSWSDRRRWRCWSTIVPLLWSTTSKGEQQFHDLVHFFFHVTRLNFHIKSRNLGLPSESVASINMHSIAYLSSQLFQIV